MADSQAEIPPNEATAEVTENTTENAQQDASTEEVTGTAAEGEAQVEATQEADGDGGQEPCADNAEPQSSDGDAVQAEAGEGEGAGATDEQAEVRSQSAHSNEGETHKETAEEGSEEEAQADPEPESEAKVEEEEEPKEEPAPELDLSEEEREKCRRIFDRKAVDDRLNLKGFKMLFRLMGQVLSAQDADAMFEEGDTDDNGTIDFDEFCRLYCKFSEEEQTRKEGLMESINKLFPSSDGEPVELGKVERLLLKMQKPDLDMRLVREKSDLNANDVRSMVRSMDKNGDGLISKQEFVETLTRHMDMA